MFDSTGENMLSVSKKLEDKSFFRCLHSISHAEDSVTIDVLNYHLCWNSAKSHPMDNVIKTAADKELLHFIESFFNHDPKNKYKI